MRLSRFLLSRSALFLAPLVLPLACAGNPGSSSPLPGLSVIRPPSEVSALALQGDEVWAGGKEGLYLIDRRSARLVRRMEPPRPITYVRALLADPAGVLWVGYGEGLASFDGESWRFFGRADGLPDERVNCLLRDHLGRLWAGTWGGAAVLEGGRWSVLTRADGLLEDMVNVMAEDDEGGLWFGSYVAPRGGLSYDRGTNWSRFTTASGLPHNAVNAIVQDGAGGLWVATGFYDRGGLCRIERSGEGWSITRVMTEREGLPGPKARSLFQDRAGVLWLGSEYDGMAILRDGRWGYLRMEDGLSAPETKAVAQDADGTLWLGTSDGVTVIRGEALPGVVERLIARGRGS
ncbi:MAG: two-component regulator propeller domain-containing protein [Acidobacteriota bacterium]